MLSNNCILMPELRDAGSPYSSVVERQSCKLEDLGVLVTFEMFLWKAKKLETGCGIFKLKPAYCFNSLETRSNRKIVSSISGIPSEGPVLFVGFHNFLGFEVAPMIRRFIIERNIIIRGVAYPMLFKQLTEGQMPYLATYDVTRLMGAVPVSASNLYKLFSMKSHVLLYLGGVCEALHRKPFREASISSSGEETNLSLKDTNITKEQSGLGLDLHTLSQIAYVYPSVPVVNIKNDSDHPWCHTESHSRNGYSVDHNDVYSYADATSKKDSMNDDEHSAAVESSIISNILSMDFDGCNDDSISPQTVVVLDAPALQDDFYLNLVDWSSNNVLAVGLGNCVYLWNACSRSRDKSILKRDPRAQEAFVSKLNGHKSKVCGLKWSYDNRELASGGNDNRLFVWNQHSTQPVLKYCEHTAAVKAIAWSPHVHGLLASGGELCNLVWSKNLNELVSTYGYSQNQIIVWRYPLDRVNQAWTGLPRGVKFDPLDHQIIWHLLAKSGASGFQPNPSTDEFIPTVVKDEGISYTHPQKLPDIVLARATYVPGDLDLAVADRIDEVLEFPLPGEEEVQNFEAILRQIHC
ncbi:FIZZY-related 2-like protein [Tanacetum coccineum]